MGRMKDLISGISISVLGVVIALMARQMRSPYPGFGPEVFPSAIGILLAIFGLILTLQGFLGMGNTEKDGHDRHYNVDGQMNADRCQGKKRHQKNNPLSGRIVTVIEPFKPQP